MNVVPKIYTQEEKETWRLILSKLSQTRNQQVCDLFLDGIKTLRITENEIPNLDSINAILKPISGFQGIWVNGLEDGNSFYKMLAERCFPIGNFIRSRQDLSYTPAPDVVHDLYGHLPFFTDKKYADFCQALGENACRYLERPKLFRQFERYFWFTIEFALIKTKKGMRIFGAGIASSVGECQYALSQQPELISFDLEMIRHQEFNIDEMQKRLFVLDNPDQLYSSLEELIKKVRKDE